MKKTYINPEMAVVKIHAQQLLTGSVEKYSETITDENEVLSRSFDFDEDE